MRWLWPSHSWSLRAEMRTRSSFPSCHQIRWACRSSWSRLCPRLLLSMHSFVWTVCQDHWMILMSSYPSGSFLKIRKILVPQLKFSCSDPLSTTCRIRQTPACGLASEASLGSLAAWLSFSMLIWVHYWLSWSYAVILHPSHPNLTELCHPNILCWPQGPSIYPQLWFGLAWLGIRRLDTDFDFHRRRLAAAAAAAEWFHIVDCTFDELASSWKDHYWGAHAAISWAELANTASCSVGNRRHREATASVDQCHLNLERIQMADYRSRNDTAMASSVWNRCTSGTGTGCSSLGGSGYSCMKIWAHLLVGFRANQFAFQIPFFYLGYLINNIQRGLMYLYLLNLWEILSCRQHRMDRRIGFEKLGLRTHRHQ